jgi:hypothetical protein
MSTKRPSSTSTLNEKRNLLLAHELLTNQQAVTNLASLLSIVATAANQTTEITRLTSIRDYVLDALAGQGTEYIFGTGVVTGKTYKYLVVNQDATFTTLAGSVTADLLTTLGITTNVVTKGMIIRGLNGELIEDVTLATGSVVGVL